MNGSLKHRWQAWKQRHGWHTALQQRPYMSIHVLDLKRDRGALKRSHFDLPGHPQEAGRYYLRRSERWTLPPSYRTGLVFFATVLLMSVLGLSAIDAHSLAESRQSLLSAQIIQELTDLSEDLEGYKGPLNDDSEEPELSSLESLLLDQGTLEEDPLPDLLQSSSTNEHGELVRMGLNMSKGYQAFQRFVETWEAEDSSTPFERLRWMRRSSRKALSFWNKVLTQAQQLTFAIFSAEKIDRLEHTLGLLEDLSSFLLVFEKGYDDLLQLLGSDEPQRLLILIQDPHERRATGGSLSAGVEILLENAEIIGWRPFHVSEYDDLLRIQLQTPQGLSKVTDRWELAHANSFVDSTRSAEQVHWFWQREARSSLDWVVFVSSDALDRFFVESGVIDLLEKEKAAQIEDVALKWSALQLSDAKEELKNLGSLLLSEAERVIKTPEMMLQAWPILEKLVREKQLVFVNTDPQQQARLGDFEMSGALPSLGDKEDFLMVSSVNSEHNATDRWIDEYHNLHTAVSPEGTIKHWLKIRLTHEWQPSYSSALREKIGYSPSEDVFRRLSRSPNTRLVRVLVPLGSTLKGLDGVPLSELSTSSTEDFTIWSFPTRVGAGETTEIALSYELPWTFDSRTVDNYRLRVAKQPGTKPVGFSHNLKLPAQLTIFQQLPEEQIEILDRDRRIAVVAGRNP